MTVRLFFAVGIVTPCHYAAIKKSGHSERPD